MAAMDALVQLAGELAKNAKSDGANMLNLALFDGLMEKLVKLRKVVNTL